MGSTKNQILARFLPNFWLQVEVKKVTSQAKLKVLQLELWFEPARLGLITSIDCICGRDTSL